MKFVYVATEDYLSEIVVERIIRIYGPELFISVRIGGKGAGYLQSKIRDLRQVALGDVPVILLADLDQKGCAPELISDWMGALPTPDKLVFRVAVREVESWLMAHRESFSEYFGIPRAKLSLAPEDLMNPKQTLLNLVRRHSVGDIKRDVLVERPGGPMQGLNYNSRLTDYVENCWDPRIACAHARSLARACDRIAKLEESYR